MKKPTPLDVIETGLQSQLLGTYRGNEMVWHTERCHNESWGEGCTKDCLAVAAALLAVEALKAAEAVR